MLCLNSFFFSDGDRIFIPSLADFFFSGGGGKAETGAPWTAEGVELDQADGRVRSCQAEDVPVHCARLVTASPSCHVLWLLPTPSCS